MYEVSGDDNVREEIDTICGEKQPYTYKSKGNAVDLVFTSDSSSQFGGFSIKFNEIDEDEEENKGKKRFQVAFFFSFSFIEFKIFIGHSVVCL